jgi:hypothetical protein
MRGPIVSYRAAVGYVGDDSFEVLAVSSSGFAYQYICTIKVFDAKGKGGRVDLGAQKLRGSLRRERVTAAISAREITYPNLPQPLA